MEMLQWRFRNSLGSHLGAMVTRVLSISQRLRGQLSLALCTLSSVLANKRVTVHQDNIYNPSKQQGYSTELHPNDSRIEKGVFKSTSLAF